MDENMEIQRACAAGAGGGDATEAKQDVIIAEVTNLDGDAMRGTDNAALAATALSDAIWTAAKAAFVDASIAAIPTTAMRGTDNAALAANALSDAIWTNAKAAFIDASIAAIPTTAMRGTDSAALATVCTAGRLGELDAANLPADIDTILSRNLFRTATKAITLSTAAVPVTESLFTVTGIVEIEFMSYIDTTVTSGGALTLEVGIVGATAGIIPQTAVGVLIAGNLWKDTSPAIFEYGSSLRVLSKDKDISHVIAGAAATDGAITYYCVWRPLSSDGNVVAA